ncbi:MAG: Ig-like domain-containing protein [Ruminiclostridium sp.]|nr:Ig-like domain-containing protein [Ruminiclostridium sp.]
MTEKNIKPGKYEIRVYNGKSGGRLLAKASFTVPNPNEDAYITIPLAKGKTMQLSSFATDPAVKWSTSNKSIVTVSSSGKITAKKAGTAVITAKYGSKSVSVKIKVS